MAKPFPTTAGSNKARFAAIDYVKALRVAPDGSRITSTEKNVAMALAQWCNAKIGVAWPSMGRLASQCCISERHCRRIIKRLELKGVIARVPMCRGDYGSQTSNEYYFPALGVPPDDLQSQQARLQLLRVPRTKMAVGAGRKSPRQAATPAPQPRMKLAGGAGHQRPPVESLRETVIDLSRETERGAFKTSAAKQGIGHIANFEPPFPNMARSGLSNIDIGRMAWKAASDQVRTVHGAKQFRSHGFQDVRISAVIANRDGSVTLQMRSPNPERTASGLQKFEEILARSLSGYYGCRVILACLGADTV
jgi:hypothetical protein